MSAEVTTRTLDARRRARSVDEMLAAADSLLETTFVELSEALVHAATEGSPQGSTEGPDAVGAVASGPLAVDLVGELAARSRHHGKRLRPVLAHWGWVVAGGPSDTREDIARVAAALSLQPLSSEVHFLLERAEDNEVTTGGSRAVCVAG